MSSSRPASITAVEESVRQEFRTTAAAREELPVLSDWGVEDFSETVHSLGINYLAVVGRRTGRVAATEYPVRLRASGGTGSMAPAWVIPDVVWWDRDSRQVVLLGEFERYEPGGAKRQILQEKVRNLLLAHRELGPGSRVLVLLLWTVSGVPVQGLDDFRSLIRYGFRTPGGWNVAGLERESQLIVATAIFTAFEGRLRLKEILL